MRLSKYLNRKYPEGIYKKNLSLGVEIFYEKFSLHNCIEKRVKKNLSIEQNASLKWFSELYQFISLIIGLFFLIIISLADYKYNYWLLFPILLLTLYRPFEIFLFSIKWVFVASDPVVSYRRSLALFLVNFVEVIIFFSIAYLASGFYKTVATSLYSSLRIVVTIGPADVEQKCSAVLELFPWLVMIQIVISFFLIVVVIANTVGVITRK